MRIAAADLFPAQQDLLCNVVCENDARSWSCCTNVLQSNDTRSTMPRKAIRCHTMLYNAIRCHTILYDAIRCHTMPHNAIQCHIRPYDAIRCHIMPYDAMSLLNPVWFNGQYCSETFPDFSSPEKVHALLNSMFCCFIDHHNLYFLHIFFYISMLIMASTVVKLFQAFHSRKTQASSSSMLCCFNNDNNRLSSYLLLHISMLVNITLHSPSILDLPGIFLQKPTGSRIFTARDFASSVIEGRGSLFTLAKKLSYAEARIHIGSRR